MKALAIILARSGSKGVPRKNIAQVAGKPCIQWTIDAATNAHHVSKVVVTTDGDEIARIATNCGATIHTRSDELATDTATIDAAARQAVTTIDPDASFDSIVLLYANVPVRPPDLIDRALDLLQTSNCDSVQSYASVGKYHPWWMTNLSDAGKVTPWQGDVLNNNTYRRQDLPKAFIPDGGVIALKRKALMLEFPNATPGPHAFLGEKIAGIKTNEGEVVDIDSPIDLIVASAILSQTK